MIINKVRDLQGKSMESMDVVGDKGVSQKSEPFRMPKINSFTISINPIGLCL